MATFPPEFMPRGVAVDGKGTVYTSGWDGKQFVIAAFPKKGKPARRPIPCANSKGFDDQLFGSIVVTPEGTLFWAMDNQHRIVRINPDGIGDCYAGTGQPGFSGDGGPASSAQLSSVTALGHDPEGRDLYVADADNSRVRRIDATGTIATVVEPTGMVGSGLGRPIDMAFDARRGRLYIKEDAGIAYRERDGAVQLIPRSAAPGFASEGLAPDPTGNDLVTTRIRECDVVRITDDGTIRSVPGGRLSVDQCAYQSAVDDVGDIWVVGSDKLIVIRPRR